ncbi:MAG: glycosyltransferase [Niabella sp.]
MEKLFLLITNLGKGGAQRVFYDHAIAFSKYYEIHEVVFDIDEEERIYNSGLPLHSLSAGIKTKNPVAGLFYRAKALRRLVDKYRPKIVISHMDGANWVNALAAHQAEKILVVHGTILYDKEVKPLMQFFRKKLIIPWLYNKADVTVGVSEAIADELKNRCGVKNAIAIPNYFDIAGIRQKAGLQLPVEWKRIFESGEILIHSGRFHIQKKQAELLEIFARVKRERPGVKLILMGDGQLRQRLFDKCRQLKLSFYEPWSGETNTSIATGRDVYFTGYVSNPFSFLNKSALFLFPSAWEGFPMALCEAMISGVPVLSADCPTGPREILAPGTKDDTYTLNKATFTQYGVLLPMADKAGFAKEWVHTIISMLSNKMYLEERASAAAVKMLDYEKQKIIKRWTCLLDRE